MRVSSHCLLLSIAVLGLLPACGTVKNVASHIPVPRLPKMSDVAKLIPGMPDSDRVDASDPEVPFNSRQPLSTGHTLRLEVYEGTRSPSRVYRGITMVNEEGLVDLGEVGSARVAGKQLPQAMDAIGAAFRVAGRTTRPVTVHLISVENTPLIGVQGDVQAPEYIPAFEDVTVKQAVTVSGGRRLGSTARGVYISRDGARRFFTSMEWADEQWSLRAGDIIILSPDI
ncbi:MAG: hypothetical protein HS117_14010 [Verrucomicrobiaceae bacterium]|jgi:protein involved in polysaccharide export with SLBB domain|nr:hypothetical protein [Verrucomicrobiaceae bacterium]